ncbi:uncharacterized protein UV8b_07443 [Ustilaginoidea virens]|uniref:Uncharacterized protein n=1 Tax=Ustilaginoidea virens TaxID=1159556 RepID=A0A8E5HXD5_USTVR|nr:uncharacterized protein UV8b_07443 [Ustilaginoidea virens]QUC23202.1 hypothetical protein UV8b_07443 [Ustilaginoidea virens]
MKPLVILAISLRNSAVSSLGAVFRCGGNARGHRTAFYALRFDTTDSMSLSEPQKNPRVDSIYDCGQSRNGVIIIPSYLPISRILLSATVISGTKGCVSAAEPTTLLRGSMSMEFEFERCRNITCAAKAVKPNRPSLRCSFVRAIARGCYRQYRQYGQLSKGPRTKPYRRQAPKADKVIPLRWRSTEPF